MAKGAGSVPKPRLQFALRSQGLFAQNQAALRSITTECVCAVAYNRRATGSIELLSNAPPTTPLAHVNMYATLSFYYLNPRRIRLNLP